MKRAAALLPLALVLTGAGDTPPYRSSPERRVAAERDWGPWLGPFRRRLTTTLLEDFGERYLYAPANAALRPPRTGEERVVFIGDSITDGWDLARAFPGKPYINRGIGSQVTAQMLVRFEQDVVALSPRAVVILGGTNDIHGVLQRETPGTIAANIGAMADIADAHGIAVVLSSILPVSDHSAATRHVVVDRPPATIREVNRRLSALARARGYAFADYNPVLADAGGKLRADLSADGLHPLASGYLLMAPVVRAAIAHALVLRAHGEGRGHRSE